MGFPKAGTLVQLDVKVGEHITRGQLLGKQDAAPFVDALNRAKSDLSEQRNRLQHIIEKTPDSIEPRKSVNPRDFERHWTYSPRASAIEAQSKIVAEHAARVESAQHDVDNALLFAGFDSTVTQITSTLGQALPAFDPADPAGQSRASAIRPETGAVIVLGDADFYQLVVPFQSEATKHVQPNSRVSVTIDAVPGLELPGTVVSVSDDPTRDVRRATIVLNRQDPRISAGQRARVSLVTSALDDVLSVPNAAVSRHGEQFYVSVLGPDGNLNVRQFVPGVVGDRRTQVRDGLSEGETVLLR